MCKKLMVALARRKFLKAVKNVNEGKIPKNIAIPGRTGAIKGSSRPKREVIKRGTDEWWTWVAILQVAKKERKHNKLPATSPVTIDVKLCQRFIQSINQNPLKKLWLLLTIGDMHPLKRDKIGNEVAIKAEDGLVHNFFRPEK